MTAVFCGVGVMAACATERAVPSPDVQEVSDARYAMGTVLEITLRTEDPEAGRRWMGTAFERVAGLQDLVSRFDPTSDVSRLNATAGQGSQRVDPRVAELLSLCVEYTRLTGGSFDVSIGPLVDLWIHAADEGLLPSGEAIDQARRQVGAERIRVIENHQVEFPTPGMSIDLGGIAKGWALDRLAEDLAQRDVRAALLNFGESSVWAIGQPQGEAGWRLALRAPGSGLAGVLTLRNRALSVSSGLEQSSEIEGRRYGHVVNPRSGQALQRPVQVAVVAGNAALAEALSTALVVQGPGAGLALVESTPGAEALWIDAAGQRTASRGWQEVTRFEVAPDLLGAHSSISSGSSSRVRKF